MPPGLENLDLTQRREWGTLMQLLDTLPARCPEPVRVAVTEALKMRVNRIQEAEVA